MKVPIYLFIYLLFDCKRNNIAKISHEISKFHKFLNAVPIAEKLQNRDLKNEAYTVQCKQITDLKNSISFIVPNIVWYFVFLKIKMSATEKRFKFKI